MLRIAFVYPPLFIYENQPNIKVVRDDYGVYPPLSLSQVAAVSRDAGHETILIDAEALKLSKEEVLSRIKEFKPDLLGFTITTYTFHGVLEWMRFLKKQTGLPIIVGGAHMSMYPKETLTHKEIDYGFMGEAEVVLPEFLKKFEAKEDLSQLPGLVYRTEKSIIANHGKLFLQNLDEAPFPARELLQNDKYYSFISKRKNFTGIIASRGCPFRCIFCEQKIFQYRVRSAKNIFEEIKECYYKHGIREFDFYDTTFTIDRKRVMELCELIRKEKLDIIWSARNRVDTVDEEVLIAMRKAGCHRIYYGIESGDQNILKTIKKGTNIQQIRDVVALTRKVGIDTHGYFMIGNPGENEETVKKTVTLAKELNLDYAQFSKLSTLPGTELYQMWMEEYKEDYWKKFVLDENYHRNMQRLGCELSEERIDELVILSYRHFYFRPKMIVRHALRMRSFDEFWRAAKTSLKMIK